MRILISANLLSSMSVFEPNHLTTSPRLSSSGIASRKMGLQAGESLYQIQNRVERMSEISHYTIDARGTPAEYLRSSFSFDFAPRCRTLPELPRKKFALR